jgi:hypothetical protein
MLGFEVSRRDMYHPSHGVHDPPAQRCTARPSGAFPRVARPQEVRLHGGRARRGVGHMPYHQRPHGKALVPTDLTDHNFLLVLIATITP